jgi:copper(I)-binding protein
MGYTTYVLSGGGYHCMFMDISNCIILFDRVTVYKILEINKETFIKKNA